MDRFVVMVDAGYLLRQSIEIVSRRASKQRGDLEISAPEALTKTLVDKSKALLNLGPRELLRIYWYDGVMHSGITPQQRAFREANDIHFRAGTVNSKGQQIGVDSLIVTDLIELASNHAICDASLVTGDGDLAIGIELAQKKGVRIGVVGVEDLSQGIAHHLSPEITSRADRVGHLGASDLTAVMRYAVPQPPAPNSGSPSPSPVYPPAAAPAAAQRLAWGDMTTAQELEIEAAVRSFHSAQSVGTFANAVDLATKRIESSIDRGLLHHVYQTLAQGALNQPQKNCARQKLRTLLGA